MIPIASQLSEEQNKAIPENVASWVAEQSNTVYKTLARLGYKLYNALEFIKDGMATSSDLSNFFTDSSLVLRFAHSFDGRTIISCSGNPDFIMYKKKNDTEYSIYTSAVETSQLDSAYAVKNGKESSVQKA